MGAVADRGAAGSSRLGHRQYPRLGLISPARVVEWQTQGPQKALPDRACGFESHPGH
jgi:hypothetical protein